MGSQLRDIVTGASPVQFWGVTTVLILVSLWLFYRGFRGLRRARLIEDTPTARIRSAPQGYVELEGEAVILPGEPVYAPLSGRPCVWYEYRIEHRETVFEKGRRRQRWVSLEHDTSDALFGLEDGTGRCVVDPDGAEMHPLHVLNWRGHERYPRNTPPGHSDFLGPYRYVESFIEPGDFLYALGWFHSLKESAERGLAEETRALLRRWKADPKTLLQRFDLNGDGQIDMKEWQIVRKQAAREVLQTRMREPAGETVHLLSKPRDRRPFILAASRQSELASRYRQGAVGALALFLFGCIALTWAVQLRLS
ncbi:MAG: GIDE domain-containing protein [Methylohalobius sp. ZOD2]